MLLRILVTGATGVIGRAVVSELVNAGYPVRALVRHQRAAWPKGVEPLPMPDLKSTVDWAPLLNGITHVVHLAGLSEHAAAAPEDLGLVNYKASEYLAGACARAGAKLVFLSSIRAQCGLTSPSTLSELDKPEPGDFFGRSKLAAELVVAALASRYVILRSAPVIASHGGGDLDRLLKIAHWPVPLPFADIQAPRSYVALADLVGALRMAVEGDRLDGGTWLVAHPNAVSLAQILVAGREAIGRKQMLFKVKAEWIRTALLKSGYPDFWERYACPMEVNAAKLISAGWAPKLEPLAAIRKAAMQR